MIILSQDKELILNFGNIDAIGIGNPLEDDGGMFRVLASTTSDNEYTLGKYKTEKRAKEVLQEIIQAIRGESEIVMSNDGISSEVYGGFYEMPKE